jgi:hypothetical protein
MRDGLPEGGSEGDKSRKKAFTYKQTRGGVEGERSPFKFAW